MAIDSVAPNGIIDFDFSSLKNIAVIANPLKGDEPIYMDVETFHSAFANTLTETTAASEFERTVIMTVEMFYAIAWAATGKSISRKHMHPCF